LSTERFSVGDKLPELRKQVVIQMMRARTWGNRNPIHWDTQYARERGFPAPIALGMMIQGYLAEMCVIYFGESFFHDSWFNIKFVRPTHPDDVITTQGVVEDVKVCEDGRRLVSARISCVNQSGHEVIIGNVQVPVAG
jgi:acyl dehydratase